MRRPAHWLDVWRVVLGSIILLAWWLLARDSGGSMVSAFCSSDTLWALPLSLRLDLALMLVSPVQLASGSALMIAAMMLPLVIAPLRHVRHSIRRRLWCGVDDCRRNSPAHYHRRAMGST